MESSADEPGLQHTVLLESSRPNGKKDLITCFQASDKLLAVGWRSGRVDLIDYGGDVIRTFHEHQECVRGLSFDSKAEFLATCSDDGTVCVLSLYNDDNCCMQKHSVGQKLTAVAIDPRCASRRTKEVVVGDALGNVYFLSKGWLGVTEKVLFKGKYHIGVIVWSGTMLAWASESGVRIYDVGYHTPIGTVSASDCKQRTGPRFLHWMNSDSLDKFLLIGWPSQVWRVSVVSGSMEPHPAAQLEATLFFEIPVEERETSSICSLLETDHGVIFMAHSSGFLVSYRVTSGKDSDQGRFLVGPSQITDITLTPNMQNFLDSQDYISDDPLFFMHSDESVVAARPLDAASRLGWLREHKKFREALSLIDSHKCLETYSSTVNEEYMEYLVLQQNYDEAGALAPRLCGQNVAAWQRWATRFAGAKKLHLIASRLPCDDEDLTEILSAATYDHVLKSCLHQKEYKLTEHLVMKWPITIYDAQSLLVLAEDLAKSEDSGHLASILSTLYSKLGMHVEAMDSMVSRKEMKVFDYIGDHMQYISVHLASRAPKLMDISEVQATKILVEQHEDASPDDVIRALLCAAGMDEEISADDLDVKNVPPEWSVRLYRYLEKLHERDQSISEYDTILVNLCSIHDPSNMSNLLQSSHSYDLESALRSCIEQKLVAEQVYVLGRMGSTIEALHLIVDNLRDVPAAVQFASECQDNTIWDELLLLGSKDGNVASQLLEFSGNGIDAGALLDCISPEMVIPRLKEKISMAAKMSREEEALQEKCLSMLESDCALLVYRVYQSLCRKMEHCHWVPDDTSFILDLND